MAPSVEERAQSVERTPEFEEFVTNLRAFHEKRGTHFEEEPKIGQKRVDLFRLYNRVLSDGGYDLVSDTKKRPLGWRSLGVDLGLEKATHPSAIAFMLKTLYYKNLAAYEITTVYKKDPPPKEILEEVSARGGNLLLRTVENYPLRKEEPEDDGTPGQDKMDIDDAGSGGRASRGLRQAPPQRQLFQSDPYNAARQTRHGTNNAASPTPSYGSHNFYNATAAQALANYEPKSHFPLSLRPVTTPASNPELFKAKQAAIRDARMAELAKKPQAPKSNIMLPGTGFPGPNIYVRTWMALKSGLLEEQEYALHHLVKISHERGDKYRFDQFGGLLEALVDKLMETTSLFYDVSWDLSYQEPEPNRPFDVLDALNGTSDLASRLRSAKPRAGRDKFETDELARQLKTINEAGLVTRNLVMLEENASYASNYPSMRDAITMILNLPEDRSITEVKHYVLEIAEQLTKYVDLSPTDPLITALMACTASADRGVILASLHAISRTGTRLEHVTALKNVPFEVIQRLGQWLLIEDQDLRGACLDLLYRYTASADNADILLRQFDVASLIRQLTRLLQHASRHEESQEIVSAPRLPPKPQPTEPIAIPRISQDHVEMLLTYDEPERSSQWLRACFEEHVSGEITQIALWQAYQVPFTNYSSSRPLLPAKDFITNVSTTFTRASAQVIPLEQPRFVIKGIRPREVPVDPKGKPFMKCRWLVDEEEAAARLQTARDTAGPNGQVNETDYPKSGEECRDFAQTPARLWEHLVTAHLGVTVTRDQPPASSPPSMDSTPSQAPSGPTYDFNPAASKPHTCRWAGCTRFSSPDSSLENDYPSTADISSAYRVGMHLKTHLPDSSSLSYQRSKHNLPSSPSSPSLPAPGTSVTRTWSENNTFFDERGTDATGLPLTAVLVLRNLARNIPKTATAQAAEGGAQEAVQSLFAGVRGQLFWCLAYNRALGTYLTELLRLVDVAVQ